MVFWCSFFNYILITPQICKVLYIINIHNISSGSNVVLNIVHPWNFIFYSIILNVRKFENPCLVVSGFVKQCKKFPCVKNINVGSSPQNVQVVPIWLIHICMAPPHYYWKYPGPRETFFPNVTALAHPISFQYPDLKFLFLRKLHIFWFPPIRPYS